jgi:hypothetical protein
MSELNRDGLKAAREAFAQAKREYNHGGSEDWSLERALVAYLAALPKQEDDAYGYLSRLLKSCAPQCEPLPDLMGLCTQIDNLVTGLRMPKQEPSGAELVSGLKQLIESNLVTLRQVVSGMGVSGDRFRIQFVIENFSVWLRRKEAPLRGRS